MAPEAATSWEISLLRRYGFNERVIRSLPRVVFTRAVRTSLSPGRRLPAELRADFWEAFRLPAVRRFVSRLCGGTQGAFSRLPPLYARIQCPTLVLWGERDHHFPLAQGRALLAAVTGSRLEVIPEAPHWMAWERADAVALRIIAAL